MNNQLRNLLEDYMEDVGQQNNQTWALSLDQFNYNGRHNVRAYLEDQNAMELHEPLIDAQRRGEISLVIDDCALIVNVLN